MWPLQRSYRAATLDVGRGTPWRWGTRTFVMGIVNATEDSFSGDGVAGDPDAAASLARSFELAGADIIDIGGASSRPGADPTPVEVERSRVVPVIEADPSAGCVTTEYVSVSPSASSAVGANK